MNEQLIDFTPNRAWEVLTDIDTTVKSLEANANKSIAHVCKLLVEVKRGAYWTERGHETEDQYIKTLPYSRSHYYNLIAIGTHLEFLPEETIAEIGIKKSEALVRISKNSPELTEEWVEKAKQSSQREFMKEVRGFFKGKDDDAEEEIEWIRIKASKGQADVINEALRIAGMTLGSEKSNAHSLEMICAEFLSGNSDDGTSRLENRVGFELNLIKRIAMRLDKNALDALIGVLASIVENDNG